MQPFQWTFFLTILDSPKKREPNVSKKCFMRVKSNRRSFSQSIKRSKKGDKVKKRQRDGDR